MNTTRNATKRRRVTKVAGTVGCLMILGAGCSKTEPTTTAATTTAAGGASTTAAAGATSSTVSAGASDPASTVTVKLFMFKPSPLTVKAGTKVTWANGDDAAHEPSSGTEASPTSDFVVTLEAKDVTGSFTFDKAGTYPYYCKIHTSMVGEIIVT